MSRSSARNFRSRSQRAAGQAAFRQLTGMSEIVDDQLHSSSDDEEVDDLSESDEETSDNLPDDWRIVRPEDDRRLKDMPVFRGSSGFKFCDQCPTGDRRQHHFFH